MKFKLVESYLIENELLEDKMVKFGGELSPKYGWCVIYIGGGASGKSTATQFLSRLQGRYFNVDDFKENPKFWKLINPKTGKSYEDGFETPPEERRLDNGKFAGELHQTFDALGKKKKNAILHNQANNSDRLPNIIFDMTGDKIIKISEIVDVVKPQGYKVAIIWVLNTFENAYKNLLTRPRGGHDKETVKLVAQKHQDVLNTANEIFNSNYIINIDEFWVIDASTDINPFEKPVEYHDAQNVYHIPCNSNGLNTFEKIVNVMQKTSQQLLNFNNKNN